VPNAPEVNRTVEQVVADEVWPGRSLSFGSEASESRRYLAALQVLRRIPESAYEKLIALAGSFEWFIPDPRVRGKIYPFVAGYVEPLRGRGIAADEKSDSGTEVEDPHLTMRPHARVLYLSPALERAAFDIVVAIVAHELAHLALGHDLFTGPQQYEAQEDEVFGLICRWGFEKEAKKHRRVNRWRESSEEGLVRKLFAQMEKRSGAKRSDAAKSSASADHIRRLGSQNGFADGDAARIRAEREAREAEAKARKKAKRTGKTRPARAMEKGTGDRRRRC